MTAAAGAGDVARKRGMFVMWSPTFGKHGKRKSRGSLFRFRPAPARDLEGERRASRGEGVKRVRAGFPSVVEVAVLERVHHVKRTRVRSTSKNTIAGGGFIDFRGCGENEFALFYPLERRVAIAPHPFNSGIWGHDRPNKTDSWLFRCADWRSGDSRVIGARFTVPMKTPLARAIRFFARRSAHTAPRF